MVSAPRHGRPRRAREYCGDPILVRPNGPGIELPAARDLTVVARRPPARAPYRSRRSAAGRPRAPRVAAGHLQCLVRRPVEPEAERDPPCQTADPLRRAGGP